MGNELQQVVKEPPDVIERNGQTFYRHRDKEIHDEIVYMTDKPTLDARVQSLAIMIAVELAKQDSEVDNLGDNESIVFVGKCPTINLVQLAEKINAYYKQDADALEKRLEEMQIELELAQNDTMGDDA